MLVNLRRVDLDQVGFSRKVAPDDHLGVGGEIRGELSADIYRPITDISCLITFYQRLISLSTDISALITKQNGLLAC